MEHDKGYKRLFSHPKMVKDLLRGFVHEEWVRDLDFATLETFKDSFVSDDLRSRHDDIIWRVRWGDDWLYVYLLLEFQSTIDSFMAVRLMVYIGLLYQHLIDAKELAEDDKLPPVLPLVIYNGAERWDAALDIGELIADAPEGLKKYRPQLQYFLIDEGSFSEAQLASLHNLTAALFRMENCRRLESREEVLGAMRNVLVQVTDWLKEPAQAGLRRDFVTWLSRVLLPNNVPGMQVPEVIELQEMNNMLYETVQAWYKEAEEKGEAKGEIKGEIKGEAKMLLYQMETKYGPLETNVREHVNSLNSEALLACSRRMLTAQTIQETLAK